MASAPSLTCGAGHALVPVQHEDHWCDVCHGQGTAHRCGSGCDFDVCAECLRVGGVGRRPKPTFINFTPPPPPPPPPANGVTVSDGWAGANAMKVPADAAKRVGSVWMESERVSALSAGICTPADFRSLLSALAEEENLSVVHKDDDYLTEWNEVRSHLSWGRIRRFEDCMLNPDPQGSVVYEDSIAVGMVTPVSAPRSLPPPAPAPQPPAAASGAAASAAAAPQLPATSAAAAPGNTRGVSLLVSTIAVQQSVKAAAAGAWVRVVGVVKHGGVSFAILQEWDGQGCVVALRGGELKPLFLREVAMGFSSAMWRRSHGMWLGARYQNFHYRHATWEVPTKEGLGPLAGPFHARLTTALSEMGHPDAASVVVQQLERVQAGFAAASAQRLVTDAQQAADAFAAAVVSQSGAWAQAEAAPSAQVEDEAKDAGPDTDAAVTVPTEAADASGGSTADNGVQIPSGCALFASP